MGVGTTRCARILTIVQLGQCLSAGGKKSSPDYSNSGYSSYQSGHVQGSFLQQYVCYSASLLGSMIRVVAVRQWSCIPVLTVSPSREGETAFTSRFYNRRCIIPTL